MEKIPFKDLPDMTTPLSSANLNQMQDNMENAIAPIKLVSISDTAPESANIGDMYYNTTDNKVYTATAENTWDSGNIPRYDGFYVNKENNAIYYYNGNTLILSGGNLTDKNIKNEETTSDLDVYSCNYINSVIQENTNYIQIGNLKICWGTVQVSYVNPNVMSSALSFPVNFTNNPTVLATINGTNNTSSELDENAKVSGVGTSSCLIYVHSKNGEFSSGWKQNVNWIAVGY